MKKAIYKARVIEDPVDKSFTVQVKVKWWSPWRFERTFSVFQYSTENSARESAIACANRLVGEMIIHEAG